MLTAERVIPDPDSWNRPIAAVTINDIFSIEGRVPDVNHKSGTISRTSEFRDRHRWGQPIFDGYGLRIR